MGHESTTSPSEQSRQGFERSFQPVPREHGFIPLRVEGAIPEELRGTLYRNGPGLFSLFGHRYRHWFDGDGLISAVRLGGGRAQGACRLVESRGLLEERRRGRAYFGAYGTRAPGFWNPWRALRFVREGGKNPANTAVLAWADRLFALCEIGRPTELDRETLHTLGESDLGGVVIRSFSAHPHRVADTGYVYNFGVRLGHPNAIDLYALRVDGSAGRIGEIPLSAPTLIHDFAATPRHLVFFVAPLEIALFRILFQRAAFADAMSWNPARGTEVIVVPLDAPASPVRFLVDAFWIWHVANAFERGSEIVVDVVRYRDFPASAEWLARILGGAPGRDADGVLCRMRIDPARRLVRSEPLADRTCEFPRIDPSREGRPHRSIFVARHSSAEAGRAGPPDTLARIDVERGTVDAHCFGPHEWPSEGVFVPRPGAGGEGDGWIVSLVYDARAHVSAWAIFDAHRLNAGPIARAALEHHVPLGFHGTWVPAR